MLEVMLLTSNGSNPKAVITARMGARKLLVVVGKQYQGSTTPAALGRITVAFCFYLVIIVQTSIN
jgi:hypothetical protein